MFKAKTHTINHLQVVLFGMQIEQLHPIKIFLMIKISRMFVMTKLLKPLVHLLSFFTKPLMLA
jgi:hypothetical protein